MPSTTVNFADVDSFEPLPEGQYDVEVDKVEVRMNKAGDGTYLNWELVVIDGEFENRRLWMITSLKTNALFRLKQVFEELGIIDDDDEEMDLEYDDDVEPSTSGGPRLVYPELEGLEAVALVKNEMYDGRERNRVEQLNGPDKKSRKKKRSAAVDSDNRAVKRARDEEEERPRRSRRRDEDEDEPKSRRRGRDDDDDDDEDEDEDEDERPRKRSSGERQKSRSRDRARRRVR